MTQFANKKVLVTGAASGIGKLMVEMIAARGAHVIMWDLDPSALQSMMITLRERGYKVSGYHCDVSDRRMVNETAKLVLQECGSVDLLINNAGVVNGKLLLELTDEQIERTFNINTLSLFWTTRAFLPAMIAQERGHIVTIASAAGLCGTPRLCDYAASKFAAVGFDESLRLELRHQKIPIRTTIVCPFYFSSGLFAGAKTRFPRLLPILGPEVVAQRIVRAIEKNQRRLLLPWFIYSVWLIRLLPVPIFDALTDFFGISKSMDEFKGRGN